MSTQWESVSFAELSRRGALVIGDGYRAKLEELGGTGPIFLRAGKLSSEGVDWTNPERFLDEVAGRVTSKMGLPGDTMITTKGNSVGRTGFVPAGSPSFVYSPHLSYWRSLDHELLEPGFLRCWSRGPEFLRQLQAMAHGTDMAPYLSLSDQQRLVMTLPDNASQRGIAATLGALDDKIESNRHAVTGALALARAYVDLATAGRTFTTFASALEVRMGSAFKGAMFSPPGVGRPLLRIRDIKTFESQTWTTESRRDETLIRPGDIVVGMDAEFRATLWLGAESVLNQRVCMFRGLHETGRAFVLAALEPELDFQEQAKTGTTVIHLNKADIDRFVVPDLSAHEHRELALITEPLIDIAVGRSAENRALAQLRDTLLPELLSGRIRVPEAREAVEEAVG